MGRLYGSGLQNHTAFPPFFVILEVMSNEADEQHFRIDKIQHFITQRIITLWNSLSWGVVMLNDSESIRDIHGGMVYQWHVKLPCLGQ